MEKRDGLLPRRAEEVAARDRIPQGPRPHRRDRRALSASAMRPTTGRASKRRFPNYDRHDPGGMRPGDRERRRQALRPLPRPRDVPDPQRARRGDRLRRPHPRQGRAEVPQLARDAAVREGPRALRPAAGARRDPRTPGGCWWSRATWTWWRSRSSASATRWRRSAPRPRRCTCPSCCAWPTSWCSASTAMPPAARRPGARWKSSLPLATGPQADPLPLPARRRRPGQLRAQARQGGFRGPRCGEARAAVAVPPRPAACGRTTSHRRRPRALRVAIAKPQLQKITAPGAAAAAASTRSPQLARVRRRRDPTACSRSREARAFSRAGPAAGPAPRPQVAGMELLTALLAISRWPSTSIRSCWPPSRGNRPCSRSGSSAECGGGALSSRSCWTH